MEPGRLRGLGLLTLSAALAACAGAPVPTTRLATSRSAVQVAEQAGGEMTPGASQRLALARSELGAAEELLKRGENREAELVLVRAQVDAEVSLAMTREAVQLRAAEHIADQSRRLREQLH